MDFAGFAVLVGEERDRGGAEAETAGLSCSTGGLAGRAEAGVVATWGTTIGLLQP